MNLSWCCLRNIIQTSAMPLSMILKVFPIESYIIELIFFLGNILLGPFCHPQFS